MVTENMISLEQFACERPQDELNKEKQNKKVQTKFEDVDFNIDMNTISKLFGSRKNNQENYKRLVDLFLEE